MAEISEERERQDEKWGFPQEHTLPEWMSILLEELGELSREANKTHFARMYRPAVKNELIQVLAVGFAIIEEMNVTGVAYDQKPGVRTGDDPKNG